MARGSTLSILILGLPLAASAQVVFTEVMYDLEGSDSGREWVEVENTSPISMDISGYRFREGATNHTLTLTSGNATLPSGGVAVIADNPAKFLADNPSFSGTLFDSSFSLGNTGETLVLKDPALLDVDQFVYSSDMGGNGDGKSLQKLGGSWAVAAPSPGSVESAPPSSSGGSASSSAASYSGEPPAPSSAPAASGSSSKWPVKPQIYPYAGEDTRVTAGTPKEFSGEALGLDEKPLENARYLWNFGDGAFAEGKRVLHTYRYPGSYVVVLDVSAGEFSSEDRLTAVVIAPEIALRSGRDASGSFLEVENGSGEEVDLSYWQLVSGLKTFALPKGTILGAGKTVRFPEDITSLSYDPLPKLNYPNGVTALSGDSVSSEVGRNASPAPAVSTPSPRPSGRLAASVASIPEPVSQFSTPTPALLSRTEEHEKERESFVWFYALGGLLALSAGAVAYLSRAARERIEIIEDNS